MGKRRPDNSETLEMILEIHADPEKLDIVDHEPAPDRFASVFPQIQRVAPQ